MREAVGRLNHGPVFPGRAGICYHPAMRFLILSVALGLGLAPAMFAKAEETLEGKVCIVDGDTLMFGGKRRHTKCVEGQSVDLWGVAAFRLKQLCRHPNGRNVLCGRYSAAMLMEQTKKEDIRCVLKAPRPDGTQTAECHVGAKNLNRHMVENGYALAYRPDTERYTAYEAIAKQGNKGMWVTTFVEPWRGAAKAKAK